MKILLRDYPSVLLTVDVTPEEETCRGGLFRHRLGGVGFLRGCVSEMRSSDRKALQDASWRLMASYLYSLGWEGFEPFRGTYDALVEPGSCYYFDLVHRDEEVRGWVSGGITDYLEGFGRTSPRGFTYCGVPYLYDDTGSLVDSDYFVDVCDRACTHGRVDLLLIDGYPCGDRHTASAFIELARRHNLHIVFLNTTHS